MEIKEDGLYRLQLRDLFGGTRNDAHNIYKLILRRAAPDFALVAWAFHMETRNQDRAALSKPIALRGGDTMALEVVAVRRDGFNGEIELLMEDLPEGVSALGLKIPAGKNRGIMLITAKEDAPLLAGNRQAIWPGPDQRCAGESSLPAGFDGLAGAGCEPGNSRAAVARRRGGLGR